MTGKHSLTKHVVYLSIGLFFLFTVLLPICSMLGRITPEGFSSVIHSPQFPQAVKNSISTALVTTLISLALALTAALCLERTAIRAKALFSAIFIVPMLIPSISHAFGLVALFGANGMVTRLLGVRTGIYGFCGIIIGSVMYCFPVAFLMFSSILRYEDATPYKAARVLGIPPFRRFTGILLPYLKKPVISAFFATFTMTVTDYGVPLMIGGKTITLSVLMYNKVVSMLDYDAGSVIGALLLLPAVAAFLADAGSPENVRAGFISEPVVPEKKAAADIPAYIFSGAVTVFILAPIIAFCFMVFETKYPVNSAFTIKHIQRTLSLGAGELLGNSLLYAVLSALFGTALAFLCAYMTARVKGPLCGALHLASLTSMAIPGVVLGLSYVIFFHDKAIYGTVVIIALVNSVHFFSSPYLMMYNTLEKVNPDLEAVGMSLGVGRLRIVRDVILPKVRHTLLEMFTYFFVNSMMTISAVSFLAPPSPKPVALMINQFEARLLLESAAFVSVMILAVNLLMKGLVALMDWRRRRI